MSDFTLAESKLEMLISGYRVNADDSAWLRSLISASPRTPASVAAPAGESPSMKTWQHDETGRICRLEKSPGPRWAEVPSESFTPLKAENLSAALRAIVRECRGPEKPYSNDSYLPPHLLDLAVAALESTKTQEHETPLQVIEAMRRDEGVDDEFVANLSPRRLRILARDGDEELS